MRGVIGASATLCLIYLAWHLYTNNDAAQDVIRLEREKDITDAIDNDDGLSWRERLRNATE